MDLYIFSLLAPGEGAYVDVAVETSTSSKKAAAFWMRGSTFFGSADGKVY